MAPVLQDGDKQEPPEGQPEAVAASQTLPPMNMKKRGPAHYWARLNAQNAAEQQGAAAGAPSEEGGVASAVSAAAAAAAAAATAVATAADPPQPLPIPSLTPVAPPLSSVAEAPAITLPVSEPPPAQVCCTPYGHCKRH